MTSDGMTGWERMIVTQAAELATKDAELATKDAELEKLYRFVLDHQNTLQAYRATLRQVTRLRKALEVAVGALRADVGLELLEYVNRVLNEVSTRRNLQVNRLETKRSPGNRKMRP